MVFSFSEVVATDRFTERFSLYRKQVATKRERPAGGLVGLKFSFSSYLHYNFAFLIDTIVVLSLS